jgi:hypothetical protein
LRRKEGKRKRGENGTGEKKREKGKGRKDWKRRGKEGRGKKGKRRERRGKEVKRGERGAKRCINIKRNFRKRGGNVWGEKVGTKSLFRQQLPLIVNSYR